MLLPVTLGSSCSPTRSLCANYLLWGCYTRFHLTVFWRSMGCSRPSWSWPWTKSRGGRERGIVPGTGPQSSGPMRTPPTPHACHRVSAPTAAVPDFLTFRGAQGLPLKLQGPAHKIGFQCQTRLVFPPHGRVSHTHCNVCCPPP